MNYDKETLKKADVTLVKLAADERFADEEPVYSVHYMSKQEATDLSGGDIRMKVLKDHLKKIVGARALSVVFFSHVKNLEGRDDLQVFFRYLR